MKRNAEEFLGTENFTLLIFDKGTSQLQCQVRASLHEFTFHFTNGVFTHTWCISISSASSAASPYNDLRKRLLPYWQSLSTCKLKTRDLRKIGRITVLRRVGRGGLGTSLGKHCYVHVIDLAIAIYSRRFGDCLVCSGLRRLSLFITNFFPCWLLASQLTIYVIASSIVGSSCWSA